MDLALDPIVYLAPVLALGVVLLLGFAGCKFEGAAAAPGIYYYVRVPLALTVTQVVFGWEAPSTPRDSEIVNGPSPSFSDETDNVFYYHLPLPKTEMGTVLAEAWTVRGQVTVQGGASPGPSDTGTFNFDGSTSAAYVTFQAMGDAANLDVMYIGQT